MDIILKKRSENKFHIQLSEKTPLNTQGELQNRSVTYNSFFIEDQSISFHPLSCLLWKESHFIWSVPVHINNGVFCVKVTLQPSVLGLGKL